MNDAKVQNAQDLFDFASFLTASGDELVATINSVIQRVHEVNQSWDDSSTAKFLADFEPYIQNINQMLELMDNHAAYVRRKGEAIAHYTTLR